MTATARPFRLSDAPMARDRSVGWRLVRDAGDVFQDADGTWYLTSLESVRFAHRHPEIFSSARAFDFLGSPVPMIPLAIDPPDHVRYRRVLDKMLAPAVVNAMEEELRLQVRELVSSFADRGSVDVVRDIARLYPTTVFMTLFGLPLADRDRFIAWSESIIGAADGAGELTSETAENAIALLGYLEQCIDEKMSRPGDDMLSRVLALSGEDAWSHEELMGLCFLFTLAGLDTVTASIGFVFLHLASAPELRRRVVSDPSLVPNLIEEVVRLEVPSPTSPRVTLSEVEVCGVHIPEGARVMLVLATANREQAGGHPDDIDLDSTDRSHVSFGGGIHRCLGAHLARRELRLVVEEFHAQIPEYRLEDGCEPEVVWPSGTLHLRSLPLVFTPTPA